MTLGIDAIPTEGISLWPVFARREAESEYRVRHQLLRQLLCIDRVRRRREALDHADIDQVVRPIDPEPRARRAVPLIGALADRNARRIGVGEHRAVEAVAEAGPDLHRTDAEPGLEHP